VAGGLGIFVLLAAGKLVRELKSYSLKDDHKKAPWE
jgi:hypothetical protein